MNFNDENKRKAAGIGATILFHLLVVVLLLTIGLPYMDPPPPETGVEMDPGELTEADAASIEGLAGGGENSEEAVNSTASEDENVVTQNTDNVKLTAKPSTSKPKPQVKKQEEPQVDQTALFRRGKVKTNGSGVGSGSGSGTSNGSGTGSGTQGKGPGDGSGTSYNLGGRGAKSLPKPQSNKTDIGNVVVTIHVDQDGNVVSANAGAAGTTLMDTNIWRKCEQAAKKAKFAAKPDAPEIQKGTITYKFRQ